MFNIIAFFEANGVEYITKGANVKRGNVNIHCTFCGAADPSFHLGVNPETNQWGCWRNRTHRGPLSRLIAALKRIPQAQAEELVADQTATVPGMSFTQMRERFFCTHEDRGIAEPTIVFPPTFKHVSVESPSQARFIRHLTAAPPEGRGLPESHVDEFCKAYGLRVCLSGDWNSRLIIPVRDTDGKLAGWTGRALGPSQARYKAHPPGEKLSKRHVFNADRVLAKNGKVLAITEGPWDCMKIDYYGRAFGVRAVATLGTAVTDAQVAILLALAETHTPYVVFDAGAFAEAYSVARLLPGAKVRSLPHKVKDPGEFTPQEAVHFCQDLVKGKF